MLTTGGGWQDQVGGLTAGIKVGHSPAALPLKVDFTYPAINDDTVKAFSDRLVLIYTGKTRLARNLLQVWCHRVVFQALSASIRHSPVAGYHDSCAFRT